MTTKSLNPESFPDAVVVFGLRCARQSSSDERVAWAVSIHEDLGMTVSAYTYAAGVAWSIELTTGTAFDPEGIAFKDLFNPKAIAFEGRYRWIASLTVSAAGATLDDAVAGIRSRIAPCAGLAELVLGPPR